MAKSGATLIVPDMDAISEKQCIPEAPSVGPIADQPLRLLALDTQGRIPLGIIPMPTVWRL